jgi:hypothetical protein
MPRALWQSWGGGQFLMSEVLLYGEQTQVDFFFFITNEPEVECYTSL